MPEVFEQISNKSNGTQPAATAQALEAFNLQKTYGRRRVVNDVSLSVERGEVVGLLGANGAGENDDLLYDDRA